MEFERAVFDHDHPTGRLCGIIGSRLNTSRLWPLSLDHEFWLEVLGRAWNSIYYKNHHLGRCAEILLDQNTGWLHAYGQLLAKHTNKDPIHPIIRMTLELPNENGITLSSRKASSRSEKMVRRWWMMTVRLPRVESQTRWNWIMMRFPRAEQTQLRGSRSPIWICLLVLVFRIHTAAGSFRYSRW